PFDSGQSLTMRSTFGQLALRAGVREQYIEMGERALKGEALPATGEGSHVEWLLRGHRVTAKPMDKPNGEWNEIPVDAPSAPLKFNLPTGIPLEPGPVGPNQVGAMNGPYLVPFPWWINFRQSPVAFFLTRDPKDQKRYVAKHLTPCPPHPIIDLRDGKAVGEFEWAAPVWANARLSPDATYLVGTDTYTTLDVIMTSTHSGWQNGKDLLFVWTKGKKAPVTFRVPGDVDWMEFVGKDQLAYVTHAPNAVMRIHDVAKNKQVAEIPLLGAKPAPNHLDSNSDQTPVYPGVEFYRPMARRGAVSANGRYVALGC